MDVKIEKGKKVTSYILTPAPGYSIREVNDFQKKYDSVLLKITGDINKVLDDKEKYVENKEDVLIKEIPDSISRVSYPGPSSYYPMIEGGYFYSPEQSLKVISSVARIEEEEEERFYSYKSPTELISYDVKNLKVQDLINLDSEISVGHSLHIVKVDNWDLQGLQAIPELNDTYIYTEYVPVPIQNRAIGSTFPEIRAAHTLVLNKYNDDNDNYNDYHIALSHEKFRCLYHLNITDKSITKENRLLTFPTYLGYNYGPLPIELLEQFSQGVSFLDPAIENLINPVPGCDQENWRPVIKAFIEAQFDTIVISREFLALILYVIPGDLVDELLETTELKIDASLNPINNQLT